MSCNPSIQAQPNVTEWKFLMARLSSDMGDTENARKVFEEILESNPLWFEALFENALLMDGVGKKNVDEALKSYQELAKEDPNDFRPYFCQGMIYRLLDRNVEAREQFTKYRQLSPKKFEVEGYLRTPLSRMKLFGSDHN
ncbi:protein SLOW GREEN 1, chloroplastic [Fagus crenata]